MADQNAPSWLTADDSSTAPIRSTSTNPPAKSGGVFKMFSREAATAHVQKAATDHVVNTAAKNISGQPDDGFTPAWATASAYTPPNDVENRGTNSAGAEPSTAENGPKPLDIDPAVLKRMQFYHAILRVLYMIASSLMGTAAGLSLVLQTNISSIFFAVYVLFFCTLLCCFEVGLHMISGFLAVNFGFLYTMTGRVIFVLFVGIMSFSLTLFGQVSMAILFAVLIFHLILMCMFPQFSQYVRQKDYYSTKAKN